MDHPNGGKKHAKLGLVSGVYIPVCLNIFSILLFLRFGMILGQIGLLGMLGERVFTACNTARRSPKRVLTDFPQACCWLHISST